MTPTRRSGEIRVGTALAFVCSECGAKLGVYFPIDQNTGSMADAFEGEAENRLVAWIDPCPNCHHDEDDDAPDDEDFEDEDDENDAAHESEICFTPNELTSQEGRA